MEIQLVRFCFVSLVLLPFILKNFAVHADATPGPGPGPAPTPFSPKPGPAPAPVPEPPEAPGPAPLPPVSNRGGKPQSNPELSTGLSGGQKAGIVIGVFAAAGLVGFGGMVYKKRTSNTRRARFGYVTRRDYQL